MNVLADLVGRLHEHTALVLGDPVLDCYLYGSSHRISREAPVLIVREDSREHRLGGAANTAANLAALGAKTILLGLVGDDDNGRTLSALARERGIDSRLTARATGWTVTKTRVLAGGLHTRKQQMLRIDRDHEGLLEHTDRERIGRAVDEVLDEIDALVISDYGYGAQTELYVEIAQRARAKDKIVVVDSRRAMSSYRGVTAVTPNEPEAEAARGVTLGCPEVALETAQAITSDLDLDVTLLTRGREGMAVAPRGLKPVLIPAHGGHVAVDVTGAGDTVVAAFTLALTAGADVVDAARLANCAASVVVRQIGTATCTQAELLAVL